MTAHRANHVGAGTAYRAREDEYVRLRRSGLSDATVPKFADNAKHVSALRAAGGFRDLPRLERLPDGRKVLVTP